jgi:hypothetical protein
VYISSDIAGAPIPPQIGEFPVGYGVNEAEPLQFPLNDGEQYDVGFIRIFLSTIRMEAIERTSPLDKIAPSPIPDEIERHFGLHKPSAPNDQWDVRTIVVKVTRDGDPSG